MTLSVATVEVLIPLMARLMDEGIEDADEAFDTAIERGWAESLGEGLFRITDIGRAVASEHTEER